MLQLKRKRHLDDDDTGPPGDSRPTNLDQDRDQTSSCERETADWPEVFSSILGVQIIYSSDETEPCSDDSSRISASFAHGNKSRETPPEQVALTDFGRQIETWAQTAVESPAVVSGHVQQNIPPSDAQAQRYNGGYIQCFGMIHDCEARMLRSMQELESKIASIHPVSQWLAVHISFVSGIGYLSLEDNTLFGQLEDRVIGPLQRICQHHAVRIAGYTPITDCMKRIRSAKRQQESIIKVDINVFGPADLRSEIGRSLSEDRLYLQHPRYREADFEYANPHMLSFDDLDLQNQAHETDSMPLQNGDSNEIRKAILDVCESETRDREYQGEIVNVHLKTKLYSHQNNAVHFMVEREIGPIREDFKLWRYTIEEHRSGFKHAVTGSWASEAHPETGGGILADDMGMGKTLSTLSLITKRLPCAREWSQSDAMEIEDGERDSKTTRSPATLIILSSLLIMNGWLKEIEDHLDTSLRILKYHGKGRGNESHLVFDSDIVLTTYHTLAAERRTRKNPLRAIKWYRIVLDEAHTIRRQATTLYTAVAELEACYRWCLTGTPIQNKLDDLGALLAFIRADPFDSTSIFRKYIITPFLHDLDDAKSRLSLLLNSICLRRKLDRLELPPMEQHRRYIDLSAKEQQHYDYTMQSMSRELSHGSREKYSGTPFGKFQIQLQLRRLCNHGTFQKAFSLSQDDLETQREDVISSIGKDGEVECSSCREKTLILATNCATTKKPPSCLHIICNECLSQLLEEGEGLAPTSGCPYCVASGHFSSGVSMWKTSLFPKRPDFLLSGYSSKMEMLLSDLRERLLTTKR